MTPNLDDGPVAATNDGSPFRLTAAEAGCLDAMLDLLIPADDNWPGARMAGVLGFVEKQLEGPYGAARRWYTGVSASEEDHVPIRPRDLYRLGLARLDQIAAEEVGHAFSALDASLAVSMLSRAERGDLDAQGQPMRAFFELVLENAMEGFFADPVHGGNRDAMSWKMVGFPGCGHDYSTLIVSHRNRKVEVPVRSIQSFRKSSGPG